jgi:hypothetical protein
LKLTRGLPGDLDESPPVSDDGMMNAKDLRQTLEGWVISVLACLPGKRGMAKLVDMRAKLGWHSGTI